MCDIAAKDDRPAEILDDPRVSQLGRVVLVTQKNGEPLRTNAKVLRQTDIDRLLEFYDALPCC
jgi:hypothetical protein